MNRTVRLACIVLLGVVASACVPFGSLWKKQPDSAGPAAAAQPPAAVELPVAQATHRFEILPGDDVVGRVQSTIAREADTLPDLARRFNVGYEEIVRANPGVDPWLPGEGTRITLPTRFILPDGPREGIVINLAAMRAFYFPPRTDAAKPREVITHPIGIGKVGWNTPEGGTKIVSKVKDPTWTPPASVRAEHKANGEILPRVVPAGPENPLGRHMMRLGWPSYLVHGTNKPYGVGMRVSHGCIRFYPEDIEQLFEMVPVGTRVTVVNQPYVLGWQGEVLHVQAYGPLEDDERDWEHGPGSLRKKGIKDKSPVWQRIVAVEDRIDWERALQVSQDHTGIPIPVSRDVGIGLAEILATAKLVRNVLPAGATWDGSEDQYADEPGFRELLSEREPVARETSLR